MRADPPPAMPRLAASTLALCMLCGGVPAAADPVPPPHAVVLMYHRFGEAAYPSTSVRIDQLEAQLEHLAEGGYSVRPLAEVVRQLATGAPLPDRVVAVTVDDAYASVYTEAYPRLRARGWPFTVFVATDAVDAGSPALMTWAQMREMAAHGAEFASHSASHDHLVRRPDEPEAAWEARVRSDLERAARRLRAEGLAGEGPKLFAYPYGEYDLGLAALVRSLGYVPFGQQSGAVGPATDPAALPRFPIAEAYGALEDFAVKVASLPLPVRAADPASPLVTGANPPRLVLDIAPGDPALDHLACFAGGQGEIPVEWIDRGAGRAAVVAPQALAPGRGRYNCTAPSTAFPGRYYWYSHAWLVRKGANERFPGRAGFRPGVPLGVYCAAGTHLPDPQPGDLQGGVARKKTDEPAFEPSMTRLEEIVRLLEGGTLTLEESLALFEEGVKLSRRCLAVLNDAERKVERLVGPGGRAEPFDLEDAEAEP